MAGRPKVRAERLDEQTIVDAALEIARHRMADLTMRSVSDKHPGAKFTGWGMGHLSGDAELLASELVANAAEHGDGKPIGLALHAMPNPAVPPVTLEKALADAFQNRFDYQQSKSRVHAAETSRSGAVLQRAPSLHFDGDYGTVGNTPAGHRRPKAIKRNRPIAAGSIILSREDRAVR